jgi:hypothetical protein
MMKMATHPMKKVIQWHKYQQLQYLQMTGRMRNLRMVPLEAGIPRKPCVVSGKKSREYLKQRFQQLVTKSLLLTKPDTTISQLIQCIVHMKGVVYQNQPAQILTAKWQILQWKKLP